MNKIFFSLVFTLFVSATGFSQTTQTINGKTYELIEEISGKATLYYNIVDEEYHYFIKKDGTITELTNTKDENGKYQEEYKQTLSALTSGVGMDVSKVKLTLGSLRTYIDKYNKASDINYKLQAERTKTKARLGIFGGISNNPFVNIENINNPIVPIFGIEAEVYDEKRTRHSIGLAFKQSLKADDFDYTSSQFGLFYRFRVLNKEAFSIYPQVTLATYTFSNTKVTTTNGTITSTTESSGSALDAPIIFGLGTDIKAGEGYITFSVNELFALIDFENNGSFPLDLRLGYKFNL